MSLHLIAADYFKSIKEYSSSIKHYLLARDAKRALKIIEREGENLVEARRFEILEDWLKRLPEKMVQGNPTLLWYKGEILRWQGKWNEAIRVYKKAKMKFMRYGQNEKIANVMWGIAILSFYRGSYKKAIRIAEKALKIIGERRNLPKVRLLNTIAASCIELENYCRAISVISEGLKICKSLNAQTQEKILLHNLLTCYTELGEINKSIEIRKHIIKEGSVKYPVGWTYIDLGYNYALKGEINLAKKALQKALEINRSFNDRRGINHTFRAFGDLNLIAGNNNQARSYYEKEIELNIGIGEIALDEHSLWGISKSYLLNGELIKAEEYIDRIFIEEDKTKLQGKALFLVTKGEIKLELGNLKEAEEKLNLAFEYIRKSQTKYELMLANAALARLYYRKGDKYLFAKHIKGAFELSKKQGYHFALIRLGGMSSSLLEFAIRNRIEPRYAEFLFKETWKQYDLRISLFGGLKIRRSDGRVADIKWKTEKSKSLFCYLLVNRKKRFFRDQLIELFWSGKSISKERANLRYALFCIRSTLGPILREDIEFIEYKTGEYGINSMYNIWLDFKEFEKLIIEANQWEAKNEEQISISKYESAIDHYSGDFLPEMYEPWSEEQKLFYREQYLNALDKVANFYLKNEKFERVIEYSKK